MAAPGIQAGVGPELQNYLQQQSGLSGDNSPGGPAMMQGRAAAPPRKPTFFDVLVGQNPTSNSSSVTVSIAPPAIENGIKPSPGTFVPLRFNLEYRDNRWLYIGGAVNPFTGQAELQLGIVGRF